jgi:hypothetical protein
MFKVVAGCALSLALCGCGGGGSTSSSVTPSLAETQSEATFGSATLPVALGTIAAGYIECDTVANTAAGNNCNNYANFAAATGAATGGTFTFTAIAAVASGDPIAQHMNGASPMTFSNGAYQVVESPGDNPPILSVAGGPWSTPGTAFVRADGSYGHSVSVQCLHMGTGNLELQLVTGSASQTLPLGSRSFATNTAKVNCTSSGGITID